MIIYIMDYTKVKCGYEEIQYLEILSFFNNLLIEIVWADVEIFAQKIYCFDTT